jgi:hypothetical protein
MLRFLKNKGLVFKALLSELPSCLPYRALFWCGLCLLAPCAVLEPMRTNSLPPKAIKVGTQQRVLPVATSTQ